MFARVWFKNTTLGKRKAPNITYEQHNKQSVMQKRFNLYLFFDIIFKLSSDRKSELFR